MQLSDKEKASVRYVASAFSKRDRTVGFRELAKIVNATEDEARVLMQTMIELGFVEAEEHDGGTIFFTYERATFSAVLRAREFDRESTTPRDRVSDITAWARRHPILSIALIGLAAITALAAAFNAVVGMASTISKWMT